MGNHHIDCDYCGRDTRGLSGVKGCYTQAEAQKCYNFKPPQDAVEAPQKSAVLRNSATSLPTQVKPRARHEWDDEFGDVLWWRFPIVEPPYCGSPNAVNWPGYHTHWTPIIVPDEPPASTENPDRKV